MSKAVLPILLISLISSIVPARAAEGATGVYLLGTKGPGAALSPPPGLYYQSDIYLYRGTIDRTRQLPTGGIIAAGVDAHAVINLSTLLWTAPWEVAGGRMALSATLPAGRKSLDASLVTNLPLVGEGLVRGRSDSLATFGDPSLGASLAWQSGKIFVQSGISVNVPVGDYRRGRLANVSFNRWGYDLTTALTWLDADGGHDVSVAAGYTVNGTNPATDYRTGDELHLEAAATQYLSAQWSASLLAYHYQQISADSGGGALLGPYKGRATAVGASLSYNFQAGGRSISTRLKYFHETAVLNRARSNNMFLTISMPIFKD